MSSGGCLAASAGAPSLVRLCWADCVELTRPRIAVMILFTVAMGSCLASAGAPNRVRLFHPVFGTSLAVAPTIALNQVLERHIDAQMQRTRNRPLSSGRLRREEALGFGVCLVLAGLAYLAMMVRQPWRSLRRVSPSSVMCSSTHL
jgi:protoheme IX farnesyltransferase